MRSDLERISDILDAILQIRRYTDKCDRSSFPGDKLVQVWVIHHLQVIGEAAAGLSARAKSDMPDIPWREIAGMRNILVHAYFRVDPEEVWTVVERDLPLLQERLEKKLSERD